VRGDIEGIEGGRERREEEEGVRVREEERKEPVLLLIGSFLCDCWECICIGVSGTS
jgi:hypothetical protein